MVTSQRSVIEIINDPIGALVSLPQREFGVLVNSMSHGGHVGDVLCALKKASDLLPGIMLRVARNEFTNRLKISPGLRGPDDFHDAKPNCFRMAV